MLCAPARLRAAVAGLDDAQLDTPYREAGWTVRQVVHHVVDSHVNAYVRFRWALTEDGPVIKPYEEKEWAMAPEEFERRWTSPDFGELRVDVLLQIYGWHGKHHVAHITALRKREEW